MTMKPGLEKRAYQREWYAKHREEVRARRNARYATDEAYREQRKREAREHGNAHKEDRTRRAAAWVAAHPTEVKIMKQRNATKEQSRALKRAWAARHPEVIRAKEARRRAVKRCAEGEGVSAEEWMQIQREYGHRCAYCATATPLSMDHIEPLALSGKHEASNIAPACRRCNSSKGSRVLLLAVPSLMRLIARFPRTPSYRTTGRPNSSITLTHT